MEALTAHGIADGDLLAAAAAWARINAAIGELSAAATPDNAERMSGLLERFLELRHGPSAGAPGVAELLQFLTDWVHAYEEANVHISHSSPVDLLRFLMESNNLRQADLAAEFGGQPVVSAVLRGKREINASQAFKLGRRFKMSPAVFLAEPVQAESAHGAVLTATGAQRVDDLRDWIEMPADTPIVGYELVGTYPGEVFS